MNNPRDMIQAEMAQESVLEATRPKVNFVRIPGASVREVEIRKGTQFTIMGATYVVTHVNAAKKRFTSMPIEGTVWAAKGGKSSSQSTSGGGSCSGV